MAQFAFLFRTSVELEPAALARRNAAAREWALARQREGTLRFPAPLEDGGITVTRDGTVALPDTVAAVLVLDVTDLASAVELARSHPGLAFGTEIEVRAVKTVAPP